MPEAVARLAGSQGQPARMTNAPRMIAASMKDLATGSNGARQPGGRSIHPGSGRRKAPLFPKGRVLRQEEAATVNALLGNRPRERALLIEFLHLIQDSQGC